MSIRTKSYAADLMELAKEDGLVEKYRQQFEMINNALNENSDLQSYLTSSDHTISDKKAELQKYFGKRLDNDVMMAFFVISSSTDKYYNEVMLLRDFLAYYYQLKGVYYGVVYSARTLDPAQIVNIEIAIAQQLEHKVKLENRIDKELLGGVKVVINNNVWDASYRAKLKNLKDELLSQDEDLQASSQIMGQSIREQIASYQKQNVNIKSSDTTGYVISVADGIVNIRGIYKAMSGELLRIGESRAMVMNLEEETIGAVLLDGNEEITEGMEVVSTGKVVETPVGDALLGRVVDAIGRPLDGKGSIKAIKHLPIERPAPGVIDRQSVNEPLQTGIKIIDSMVPIGKGQRELIIGDRQTGKTAIAVDVCRSPDCASCPPGR